MVVFYTHVEFIPGNVYIAEPDSSSSIDGLGLTHDDFMARYGQYIPENLTVVRDYISAVRPQRSGFTAIYLGDVYYDGYAEPYHVVYIERYGDWSIRLVPMRSLYHVIPGLLYNGQNVAHLKNDLATIFKHSYQTANDRFRAAARTVAVEYTNGFITILGHYHDSVTWQPILSYNKKEKTFEVLGSVTSKYFDKEDVSFLNAVILSLFSSQRCMFMTVEDEGTFEFIQL